MERLKKLLRCTHNPIDVIIKEKVGRYTWIEGYEGDRVKIVRTITDGRIYAFVDHKEIYERSGDNDTNEYGVGIEEIDIEKTLILNTKKNKKGW